MARYVYIHPACGGVAFALETLPAPGQRIPGPRVCAHCGQPLGRLLHRHIIEAPVEEESDAGDTLEAPVEAESAGEAAEEAQEECDG